MATGPNEKIAEITQTFSGFFKSLGPFRTLPFQAPSGSFQGFWRLELLRFFCVVLLFSRLFHRCHRPNRLTSRSAERQKDRSTQLIHPYTDRSSSRRSAFLFVFFPRAFRFWEPRLWDKLSPPSLPPSRRFFFCRSGRYPL